MNYIEIEIFPRYYTSVFILFCKSKPVVDAIFQDAPKRDLAEGACFSAIIVSLTQ